MEFVARLSESTTGKRCINLYKNKDLQFRPINGENVLEWATAFLTEYPTGLSLSLAEKVAFNPKDDIWPSKEAQIIQQNDIYTGHLSTVQDTWKINTISPCTLNHITKYLDSPSEWIHETALAYESIVKPWIQSIPPSRTKWIDGILDGTKEQEDVVFQDDDPKTGFIVLPDQKWDKITLSSLYWLVLVRDKSIQSLRDLTMDHLPLLENIATKIKLLAQEKYQLSVHQLRFFIHYHPSYYHFHIHVVHIKMDATAGMVCGQAHLLEDVVESIKHCPTIYQTRTLAFQLSTNHPLYPLLSGRH